MGQKNNNHWPWLFATVVVLVVGIIVGVILNNKMRFDDQAELRDNKIKACIKDAELKTPAFEQWDERMRLVNECQTKY